MMQHRAPQAQPEVTEQRPQTPRIKRFRIAANVAAQITILAAIVLMINYLGFNRYARWDLSRNSRYALSPLTKKFLESLKKEVRIFVFFSPTTRNTPGPDLYDDVQNLLKEYEFAAKRKLRVENIDPYRDLTRARELQERYKFGTNENLIILEYQGRKKFIPVTDLAEYDASGMFNNAQEISAFKGEQVITGALIELVEDRQTKIGLVTGQGEAGLGDGSSLSRFESAVERQNLKLEDLSLAGLEKIPGTFGAVILAGPAYDLTDHDIAILQTYWDEKGRLLLLLNPRVRTPKLDAFLAGLGVRNNQDIIVSKVKTGLEEQSVTPDVYGRFLPETPFLKPLAQTIGYFPGGTRSLSIDEARLSQLSIRATRMLTPSLDNYWGAKDDILDANKTPEFRKGIDLSPPLFFGWALEKGASQDQRVQLRSSSRMVVLGNTDFLRDESLNRAAPDTDFVLLCLNWLNDREQLLAIAPREQRTFMLNLRPTQMERIVLLTVIGIPLLFAMIGSGIWVIRRR